MYDETRLGGAGARAASPDSGGRPRVQRVSRERGSALRVPRTAMYVVYA